MLTYQNPTILLNKTPFCQINFSRNFFQNSEMSNCFFRTSIYALRCGVSLLQICQKYRVVMKEYAIKFHKMLKYNTKNLFYWKIGTKIDNILRAIFFLKH